MHQADLAARYGKEKFAVFLPHIRSSAVRIAEAMSQEVQKL